MGGGQALRLGLTRSDQFHWIAGFSSAIKKHNLVTALTPLQDQLELEQSPATPLPTHANVRGESYYN